MQLVQKQKLYNASLKVNGFAKQAFSMGSQMFVMGLITCQTLFAEETGAASGDDIFERVGFMANEVYTKVLAVFTVICVALVSIALLIRAVSKKQKAVDEANDWIKRIVESYVIVHCLGVIITFIAPLVEGAGWTYDGKSGGTSGGAEATTKTP